MLCLFFVTFLFLAHILTKKVWCDSSWTHSMSSSRCLCRGLWRMLHPLTCRLRPSTHLERWRNRWVTWFGAWYHICLWDSLKWIDWFSFDLFPAASVLAEVWANLPVQTHSLGKRWCSLTYDAKRSQTPKSHVSDVLQCLRAV